ncbi:uncharacterized protein LOC110920866 isoform X3 [Helianthus annuus]|uniref:uncharacterized protein LOC110920866 isoform X3 n=1 Tax=Helianthus annuus TaxID=4232 RepID=UPI0016532FD1|nr:uncharacterized protein LOC110920866 isoform X3 [Helianthus annuus]
MDIFATNMCLKGHVCLIMKTMNKMYIVFSAIKDPQTLMYHHLYLRHHPKLLYRAMPEHILWSTRNITMLRAVDAFQENFTVKVRVIRIWDHPDKRNPKDIYSMDMILIDEEFQASLVEKQCLIVTNPTIGFNNSTYKYVQNQNKICFQSTTQVTECQDFGGSPYGFDFANFGDILNHAINESVTVDVIGYLTRSFPKEVIRNKFAGKESVKVTIEISYLENWKVYVTL